MSEQHSPPTLPTFHYSETPDGSSECYANHLQVFWSGIDLTLVFGKLLHSAESIQNNKLEIEDRATVTMPWSLAKLVATALADAVAKYEEKNGPIKLPAEYKLP